MDLILHFSRKYIQMIKRYVKKCSVSLVFREMQIHTTVRDLFSPVRMTTRKEKSVDQVLILLVVIQNSAVAIENNMEIPQKIKRRTVKQNQQSYFWVFIQKNRNQDLTEVHACPFSVLHYSQPKCPQIDECVKKNVIYKNNVISVSLRKNTCHM